jgi:hypothetical protein
MEKSDVYAFTSFLVTSLEEKSIAHQEGIIRASDSRSWPIIMWSILWNIFDIWKRFRLFSTNDFCRPQIGPRVG